MYNKVDEKFLAGLQAIVGKENVYTDPETLDQYKTDEETDPSKFHTPEAVVAPGSTEEVAAIVKLANEANIPITVRSAGTSLADGAIAVCGGIILLMGRMNRILEVNTEGLYLVAEAALLLKNARRLPRNTTWFMREIPAVQRPARSAGTWLPMREASRPSVTA